MLQPLYTFISAIRDTSGEWADFLLKKPMVLLGEQGKKVGGMFLGLPRQQAIAVYGGLLWVVPIAMASQFESLYMVKLGLSETEIGVYRALMNAVGLVGFFVGGYVSDFWGRKKAIVLFDSISWGGYCLSLALASGKWWCVSALFFMALVSASVPAYLCLLSEGITTRKRTVVFTVLQMVNQAPYALFFPILGGLWVAKRGLLQANHEMYWLFAGLVAVGIFMRWRLLPKSRVFEKSPKSWLHAFREAFRQYRAALGNFFKKPVSRMILASKFLDEWMIALWGTTYASLYYVNHMGLKDSNLAVLVQGSTYVGLLILFLIIPNLSRKFMVRILGLDQLLGLGALLVLLAAGSGGGNILLVCLLSASLGSAGNALYNSVNASIWMSIMGERERAKVVASSLALIRIGLISTSLGALIYGKVSPQALLWFMVGLRVIGFFLLRRVARDLNVGSKGELANG